MSTSAPAAPLSQSSPPPREQCVCLPSSPPTSSSTTVTPTSTPTGSSCSTTPATSATTSASLRLRGRWRRTTRSSGKAGSGAGSSPSPARRCLGVSAHGLRPLPPPAPRLRGWRGGGGGRVPAVPAPPVLRVHSPPPSVLAQARHRGCALQRRSHLPHLPCRRSHRSVCSRGVRGYELCDSTPAAAVVVERDAAVALPPLRLSAGDAAHRAGHRARESLLVCSCLLVAAPRRPPQDDGGGDACIEMLGGERKAGERVGEEVFLDTQSPSISCPLLSLPESLRLWPATSNDLPSLRGRLSRRVV